MAEIEKHPDGHLMLDGARWHRPKTGSPTECEVPGCTRVLGQQRASEDTDDDSDEDEDA